MTNDCGKPRPTSGSGAPVVNVMADSLQLPRLLTIATAARLLGVGRSTAYELIAAGELEVVHIGRSARVPVAAIDAYIERLRARAGVTAAS